MINKKIYTFVFIALLSFVSLSISPAANLLESTSESAIECVEQKNSVESETKEFSYLSLGVNFDIYEIKSYVTGIDVISTMQISNNLLRPPIYS